MLTADTYTSVLPAAQRKAAEATARLVLDAARNDRDKITIVAQRTRIAPQISEGIASHAGSRPKMITAHRTSAGRPKRSAAVATARHPHGNHSPHRTQ